MSFSLLFRWIWINLESFNFLQNNQIFNKNSFFPQNWLFWEKVHYVSDWWSESWIWLADRSRMIFGLRLEPSITENGVRKIGSLKRAFILAFFFMYLGINKFFNEVLSFLWIKQLLDHWPFFIKLVLLRFFLSSWDVLTGYGNQRFWCSRMLSLHKRLDRAHISQLEPDVIH